MQAGMPELVNRTALDGQWQCARGQTKGVNDPQREAFGDRGDQIRMAKYIAQRNIVRHGQAYPALQALTLQRFINAAVPSACGQHPDMRCG